MLSKAIPEILEILKPDPAQIKEEEFKHERRGETTNWSKAALALKIAKVSVSGHITKKWQTFLLEWKTEELEHLQHFFSEVDKIRYQENNREWKITNACPTCPVLFEKILQLQRNPKSRRLVWQPDDTKRNYRGSTLEKRKRFDSCCNICKESNCIFYAEREGIDLQEEESFNPDQVKGHTEKALDSVRDYYWRIGNMFMFYGKERNLTKNTSPADTDPAAVFKMMKNCKLFDEDDETYEQVLEARNYLMHSSNHRIPKDDFDNCIQVFREFVTTFEKEVSACGSGKQELEKLVNSLEVRIDEIKLYQDASKIQNEAIQFDIHISGRLSIPVFDLQNILTVNKRNSGNANGNHDGDESLRTENERLKKQVDALQKDNQELNDNKDRAYGLFGGALAGTFDGAVAGAQKGAAKVKGMPLIPGFVGATFGGIAGGLFGVKHPTRDDPK